jgi:hypothetical protein
MRTIITRDGIQMMAMHRQGEVRLSRTPTIITVEEKSHTKRTTDITNEIMRIEEQIHR